jgi:hypothetical protein
MPKNCTSWVSRFWMIAQVSGLTWDTHSRMLNLRPPPTKLVLFYNPSTSLLMKDKRMVLTWMNGILNNVTYNYFSPNRWEQPYECSWPSIHPCKKGLYRPTSPKLGLGPKWLAPNCSGRMMELILNQSPYTSKPLNFSKHEPV